MIGHDDTESISLKTAWAVKQGFRGVFFWQIGGDLQAAPRDHLAIALAPSSVRVLA